MKGGLCSVDELATITWRPVPARKSGCRYRLILPEGQRLAKHTLPYRPADAGAQGRILGQGPAVGRGRLHHPGYPWILLRTSLALDLAAPYTVRLYTTIQASLLFCALFSAFLAQLSRHPAATFAILTGNSLLHLLLDATQVKWANGVHLLARSTGPPGSLTCLTSTIPSGFR